MLQLTNVCLILCFILFSIFLFYTFLFSFYCAIISFSRYLSFSCSNLKLHIPGFNKYLIISKEHLS